MKKTFGIAVLAMAVLFVAAAFGPRPAALPAETPVPGAPRLNHAAGFLASAQQVSLDHAIRNAAERLSSAPGMERGSRIAVLSMRADPAALSNYLVDEMLVAWEFNHDGQLGDGTRINRNIPLRVGADADWAAVSGGGGGTIAVRRDGSVWQVNENGIVQIGAATN